LVVETTLSVGLPGRSTCGDTEGGTDGIDDNGIAADATDAGGEGIVVVGAKARGEPEEGIVGIGEIIFLGSLGECVWL
jgi:hypothetical protein